MMPIIRPTLPELGEVAGLLQASWERGQVTSGPLGRALEDEVCHRTGALHTVAVSSCTAGLMLTVRALNLPPGSEVMVPSFTFAATAQALVWNGLVPVFCDSRADDLTLDPDDVERNLSPRAAAICAAYIYGLPPDVEELSSLAARHGLPLYLDSAQGLGAEYGGRRAGGLGITEIFSMSPTKVVTAIEGGLICTEDAAMAERLRSMRDYGKDPRHGEDMIDLGLSARMSELHAAVGLLSLRGLDELVKARLALVETYRQRLGRLPGCRVQTVPRGRASSGNYFVLFITERARRTRDEVGAALAAAGIQTKRYFNPPLHQQTLFRRVPCRRSDRLTHAERASREALALPLYGHMTFEQLDHVCREVERILA